MIDVYRHTSRTSEKSYIGYSKHGIKKRFRDHISRSKYGNSHFHRAIRKYGNSDFDSEILYSTNDLIEAKSVEKFYISWFDSFNNGYNMTTGGEGNLCIRSFNINTGEKEITSSEEFYNRPELVGRNLGSDGSNISKSMKGKPFSLEHRHNISKSMEGKVRCFNIDTGENDCVSKIIFHNSDNLVSHNFGTKVKDTSKYKKFGTKNNQFGKKGKESACGGTIWVKNLKRSKRITPRFLPLYKLYGWKMGKHHSTPKLKSYICIHCGKHGKGSNMMRYHFDNCKLNINNKSNIIGNFCKWPKNKKGDKCTK